MINFILALILTQGDVHKPELENIHVLDVYTTKEVCSRNAKRIMHTIKNRELVAGYKARVTCTQITIDKVRI